MYDLEDYLVRSPHYSIYNTQIANQHMPCIDRDQSQIYINKREQGSSLNCFSLFMPGLVAMVGGIILSIYEDLTKTEIIYTIGVNTTTPEEIFMAGFKTLILTIPFAIVCGSNNDRNQS